MIYVNGGRGELLHFLPKGLVVAEIGTQTGYFAKALLKEIQPTELHLIDPWVHHEDEEYEADAANVTQTQQDKLYSDVAETFKSEIADGVVHLHRDYSPAAAGRFSDGYFDMIYIDAMHYHAAVLADLMAWAPKLKPSGILAGHDLCEFDISAQMNFGVVSAVSTFIQRSKFSWAFLAGGELFGSFFLCDKSSEDWVQPTLLALKASNFLCLELPDSIVASYHHKRIMPGKDDTGLIPSFV
jgi:hypothetical protein